MSANYTPSNFKFCTTCGKPLSKYEEGLSKKMLFRDGSRLMCYACMENYTGLTKEELVEKAEWFKKQGCTLFIEEKK